MSNYEKSRLSRKFFSTTFPGFFRLISNSTCGASPPHSSFGETLIVSKTVTTLQIGPIRVTMGGSICKYENIFNF